LIIGSIAVAIGVGGAAVGELSGSAGGAGNGGLMAEARCATCRHSRDTGRLHWRDRMRRRAASDREGHRARWYIERWIRAGIASASLPQSRDKTASAQKTTNVARLLRRGHCGVKRKWHKM